MSRKISTTFTDAVADALERQAMREGQGPHAQVVIKRAVRYWLNKNGHSASELDMDDESYRDRFGGLLRPVPSTRKGITEQGKEVS